VFPLSTHSRKSGRSIGHFGGALEQIGKTMIETNQFELQPLNHRGRPTKFTPERMQQVRNLVERGKSRDEIAEIIGVTTGSLQVTCSKLGISLRRPTFNTGTGLLQRQRSRAYQSALPTQSRPRPENTGGESATGPQPALAKVAGQTQAGAQPVGAGRRELDGRPSAAFAIRMVYKGQQRLTDLPIHEEIIGDLAMEAEIRGMGIGELVGSLISAMVKKDLLQLVR
jgi:helix-turn-helix resolvase-like protein